MSFLKEQTSLLKTYLRSDFRKTVLWCAGAMALFVLSGFVLYLADPETADAVIEQFMQMVLDAGVLDTVSGNLAIFPLLQNNWSAMLTILFYGLLPFIYMPAISLFSNGALLGIMAGMYWHSGELTMGAFLAGILPHGIFEIPALLLSAACGICLCRNTSRLFIRKSNSIAMTDMLGDALRLLVLLVAPMTVAAAAVECYLTPIIMGLFM